MASTKIIKLTGGENLIAGFTKNTDGTVTFFKALQFIALPTGDPKEPIGLQLGVAFPYAEDPENVTLPKTIVHYVLEPNKQILAEFVRQTSGLVLPKTVT